MRPSKPQSKSQQDELTKLLINGWYLKDEKGPWQDGSMRVITPKPETIKAIQSYIDKAVKETRIELLERICCCDVEPINKDAEYINVCHADHLEMLEAIKRGDKTL